VLLGKAIRFRTRTVRKKSALNFIEQGNRSSILPTNKLKCREESSFIEHKRIGSAEWKGKLTYLEDVLWFANASQWQHSSVHKRKYITGTNMSATMLSRSNQTFSRPFKHET
jgi:hypothetical protein